MTLFIIILLIYGILVSSLVLYQGVSQYIALKGQREKLQSQVNFWTSVSDKYNGYKDVYFRIALLEYQLLNFDKAREYDNKALLLDPNDKNAKNLQEILNTK